MKLLVIGAHHGVGALVVAEAEGRALKAARFEGDVRDASAVAGAVTGRRAVVSTLGPGMGSPEDLCSTGTANIVSAMKAARVRRLIVVSGAIIGYPETDLGLVYRFIETRVPDAMLADRREAERIVRDSGLDWTLIRPTRLTDAPPKGQWRSDPGATVGAFAHIARADVAAAILDALADEASIGQTMVLQY